MIGAVQEDKRIRRTKKLLRQALTRLMQQKDFQSITVTDVVREPRHILCALPRCI